MDITAKTLTEEDFQYPPEHAQSLDLVRQILAEQADLTGVAIQTPISSGTPIQASPVPAGMSVVVTPLIQSSPEAIEIPPDVEIRHLRQQLKDTSSQIDTFEEVVNRKNKEYADLESRYNEMVAKVPEIVRTACEKIASQSKPQEFANTTELVNRGVELFGPEWAGKYLVAQLASLHPIDNFIELRFGPSPDTGREYSVTVQRIRGKTPAELVHELQGQIRLLETMLQQKRNNENDLMELNL
jgi:hypothetical protein